AELVNLGCDLPVVELSLRYHEPVKLGMVVVVKTRMANTQGVRLDWDYEIQSLDGKELYVTAKVTLVTVDREKGKIMRRLPPSIEAILTRLSR
ncbi:MAG: acyl-CoA thioesterase, partial [Trichodesmium sp. MAG_R03]|nr:acyl-CoA thioesterase [Trichodesmium sp. MAG_R03]